MEDNKVIEGITPQQELGKMTWKKMTSQGWMFLRKEWVILAQIFSLIFFVSFIDASLGIDSEANTPLFMKAMVTVLALISSLFFSIALTRILLQVVRGEKTDKGLIFQGHRPFKTVWRYIFSSITFILIILSVIFIALVPLFAKMSFLNVDSFDISFFIEMGITFFGVFLLAIIILSYLVFRFTFAPYILIDKEMPVFRSFVFSWKITRGKGFFLLKAYTLLSLIILFGILAFFVGLIIAIPLSSIIFVMLYDYLIKNYERTQESQK